MTSYLFIQLLLNRFAAEDESQKLHHIIVRQNSRLSQKGFQHSGTSAKAVSSFTSGQSLDFAFQPFLPVLGCGQLSLRNILVVFQLFQFLIGHRVNSFRNNGQNKSDQLFTVDRLCSGHSLFLSNQNMHHKKVFGLSSSIEYFIKSNFSLLFL